MSSLAISAVLLEEDLSTSSRVLSILFAMRTVSTVAGPAAAVGAAPSDITPSACACALRLAVSNLVLALLFSAFSSSVIGELGPAAASCPDRSSFASGVMTAAVRLVGTIASAGLTLLTSLP